MTEVIEKTENKKGYKKTKLGWIPEDWEECCLKDITTIFGRIGFRGYTKEDIVQKDEGAISLSPTNIKNERICYDDNTYISNFKYEESPEIKIYDDDIIFVKTGSSYGKSAIIKNLPQKATINPQLIVFKDIKINRNILFNILNTNSFNRFLQKIVVAGAIPTLSQEQIYKYPITLPTKKEQEKIAEILSAWDDGIETLEKLIEVKKHYLKNIAKKLLSNKTKSSEWSEFSLGSISINLNKKVCEKKLPVLSITAGTGFVLQSDKFGKNIAGNQYKNYTLLRKNEFSYNKGNSKKYAQGCVYCLKNYEEAAVPNVFISFKLNNEIALNEYFEQLFKYNYHGSKLKKYINSGVRDDGLLNLNSNNFFKIKFKIPQIEEQQKIVDVLNSYDREIELLNLKLEKLKEQKKGLMQKLLTGQIRVKV